MWSVLTLVGIVGLSVLSKFLSQHIFVTVISENEATLRPDLFSGERVYNRLQVLNDIGIKPTGSYNNEVKTVNFLKTEFEFIQSRANKNQKLLMEHQIYSGKTGDSYRGPTEYRNLQNIVMTLLGQDEENSILVNCHFDSAPGSFGASDDGANCVIMLEILRVLAQKQVRQKWTIVFLFNGAEEPGLLGSQAFMENYKGVTNISAFVNLESSGSGGKEILFQSSPKNYWLLEHYRKSVKRPFGQAMADEVFKSGLVPAGTDYEIFVNYLTSEKQLGFPGLDFAQFKDGYRYHTKNDHVRFLKPEEMQHTGENILGLVTSLANADELPYPAPSESAVYFDFIGSFMIVYSSTVGIVLNIVIGLLAFLVPYIWHAYEHKAFVVLGRSLLSAIVFVVAIVASVAVCYLLAWMFQVIGKTMSWYTSTYLAPGIYSSITLLVTVSIYHIFIIMNQRCFFKSSESHLSVKYNLNGINLLFGILSVVLTAMKIQSTYIFMVILFISLILNSIIIWVEFSIKCCRRSCNKYNGKNESRFEKYSWIVIHLIGHIGTIMWAAFLYFIVLELFIPIAGKSGGDSMNYDIMIGAISAVFTILICMYYIPLIEFIKNKVFLYVALIILFVSFFIIAMTGLGFPFSGNQNFPTQQRMLINNVQRILQNTNGQVTLADSGFVFGEYDALARRTVDEVIKPRNFLDSQNDPFCDQVPYCGYNGGRLFLKDPALSKVRETKLEFISRNNSNLVFSLVGKYQTSLYIKGGTSNLTTRRVIYWKGAFTEIVEIVYGKEDLTPSFFEVEPNALSKEIQITVITADVTFEENQPSPAFTEFVQQMPAWTTTTMVASISRTYKFSV